MLSVVPSGVAAPGSTVQVSVSGGGGSYGFLIVANSNSAVFGRPNVGQARPPHHPCKQGHISVEAHSLGERFFRHEALPPRFEGVGLLQLHRGLPQPWGRHRPQQ